MNKVQSHMYYLQYVYTEMYVRVRMKIYGHLQDEIPK